MKLLITDLEDYMLPCYWKQSFGVDCLGCGMQRSLNYLIKGEFGKAFYMYPAIYTIILMFIFLVIHLKYNFKQGHKVLLSLFAINIIIIVTNFIIKTF